MKQIPLQLLDSKAFDFRLSRIYRFMDNLGASTLVVSDNANKFYLTGRIFDGWVIIDASRRDIRYFVRRQPALSGAGVHTVRKPEEIPAVLAREGLNITPAVALELRETSYANVVRMARALGVKPEEILDGDAVLMGARAVKAPDEVQKIRECATTHDRVYSRIPHLYREGMDDVELQVEIERVSRLEGAIGIMRVSGDDMELNMGSVLVGANADTPSPYDFALGGAGSSPALPVGADGTIIQRGLTVMVDTNGDFNGYMSDMTRTFIVDDEVCDEARRAHQLSIDICRRLEHDARPGTPCSELYETAIAMAREAGLEGKFMGHRHQAGFIGHGVGITINELPVLSPRSKDILEENNIIAIEPKFVIDKVGAVGVENTYRVGADGLERLTVCREELVSLED